MPANPLTEEVFYDHLGMLIEFHGWELSPTQKAEYCALALEHSASETAFTEIVMNLLGKDSSLPEELLAAIDGTQLSDANDGLIRVSKLVSHLRQERQRGRSLQGTTEVWRQIVQAPVSASDRREHFKRRVG